jgi:hypothetical protein
MLRLIPLGGTQPRSGQIGRFLKIDPPPEQF